MSMIEYQSVDPLPPSEPGDELEVGPRGWVARLRAAAELAGHIADTDFVPTALRGNRPAIAAAILYGAEVGLEPMQALAKVSVIKGRPSLYAEAQRGLILAAGHELWFEETTATRAIAAGRRAGSDRVGRIAWTLDDAKRARIAGGENWTKYPAAMLRARASADLARAMFADVIGGMPAIEELEDATENGPGPDTLAAAAAADPTGAAASGRRPRQRKRSAAASSPQASPPEAAAAALPPTPPTDEQQQPPVPPADDPPATGARKRQIFALMRDVGMSTGDTDRDERLEYVRGVTGRPDLASSNDLTQSEALRVVDDLTAVKALPADRRRARISDAAKGQATLDQPAAGEDPGPPGEQEAPEAAGSEAPPPDDDIPF